VSRVLYRVDHPVTLVGGGPVAEDQLAAALALAPLVVAADSGGDLPMPAGHRIHAAIGDMDSLADPGGLAAAGTALHPIVEQATTDFEKCLYSVEAPLFLGLGFLGGRLDHALAAMNALVRYPDKRIVLLGAGDVCFLCPDELALELEPGTRVSFFPMAPVTGRRSEGLRWSVDGLALSPAGAIGTSNQALGGPVRVAFDSRSVVTVLPERLLGQVVARLLG
jgi:thiamine pyrophosphokinase